MNTFTVNGDQVELFAPLMKFDERSGEFGAWSSVEEIDSHGEICDIEKSWPAIIADAQQQLEISGGKSVGVLRRQHRRDTSIGKLTLVEKREREGVPGVWIQGVCTDEKAKQDASTGVLTGVSIRGLATRWPDAENANVMRYAWTLREEDSLVDRPAVPHALIEVMKSDGGMEMVEATGRQPTQFWDCRLETCPHGGKHTKKEEAMKCDGLPNRVEAMKSLWTVADLVALLSTLLCITDDAEWTATWDAIDAQQAGETESGAGKVVVGQLKEIAAKVFDALQTMIAEERAQLDVGATAADDTAVVDGEMAMSLAMRALGKSDAAKAQLREVAKQFTESLRVHLGNGSNAKENQMKDTKKAEGDAPDPAKQMEEVLASIKAMQESLAGIDGRLKTIEEAKSVDAAAAADTAKALADIPTQVATIGARVEEIAKQATKVDAVEKSVGEIVESVKSVGESVETLYKSLPVARKGQFRAASKEDETKDTSKGAEGDSKEAVNPWRDASKTARIG